MKWQIWTIGKPKLTYARLGVEEYLKRVEGFANFELHHLKNSDTTRESTQLLEHTVDTFRIVLDERGELVTSRLLSLHMGNWEQQSIKTVSLIIGGADGHTAELRSKADWLWSLSTLTLQHEMALVFVLEQIYRAYTIRKGLPYHRE